MIDTEAINEAALNATESLKTLIEQLEKVIQETLPDFIEEMDKYFLNQEEIEWERQQQADFRDYASSRAAARVKAYRMQMTHEKARQTMRRRKLLHC